MMRIKYQKTVRDHWCTECNNEIPQGEKAIYYAHGGNVVHRQCLPEIVKSIVEYQQEINKQYD